MAGVTAAFIATLPWLGLTLGLLLGMFAALWVMGVRRRRTLVGLPLVIAAAAYLLFIVVLQSDFPHGPIEKLLS
jgi:peptidoglycan/LPS O-acetylase OafA/YrhL